ncbi:MAG: SDR family NAD(P)-dependent oxidoreductase [Sphingobium sp.]
MSGTQTVLILGASRGLGLAMAAEWSARGAKVIATARGDAPELSALGARYPESLSIETADLDNAASMHALRARLEGQRIDILFVNGGIAHGIGETATSVDEGEYLAMMRTNALGPLRALEILQDLVPADGVLAVMSSELGSITNNNGFWTFYSASKAALNMLIKGFAAQHGGGPAVLLVCPGWIRTDMGGARALFSIEETIPDVVTMVAGHIGRPGLRFVDRFDKDLPW